MAIEKLTAMPTKNIKCSLHSAEHFNHRHQQSLHRSELTPFVYALDRTGSLPRTSKAKYTPVSLLASRLVIAGSSAIHVIVSVAGT